MRRLLAAGWLSAFCLVGVSSSLVPVAVCFAQPANDDGDGDDNADDDDAAVPDPDDNDGDNGAQPSPDTDSGGDDGGGATDGGTGDSGADDGGSGDGGTDDGGSSGSGGSASDSDDGASGGGGASNDDDSPAPSTTSAGDDDSGSPSTTVGADNDDDGPTTSVAAGAAGNDDDDGPTTSVAAGATGSDDDDDDDGPAVAPGKANAGDDDGDDDNRNSPVSGENTSDDDRSDDNRVGNDQGNDDNEMSNVATGPETVVGGGDETDRDRTARDAGDGVEVDRDGFRYRKNEFIALDLPPAEALRLNAAGFRVIESAKLASLGTTVSLIKSPARRSDQDTLDQIEAMSDSASVSFNYLFDTSTASVRKAAKSAVRKRTSCGCDIGLIDTGVATTGGLFKHVEIVQKSFNGITYAPKLHGTAVAYLFAGNENGTNKKRTRVFVGDIFGNDRAKAGSAFALVKALDWMAQMKVPVINVSLAGPKSEAVAKAIEALTRKGHIVVAAAGNDGPVAPPVFPGAYSSVVAVTAVDSQTKIYRYANRGNYIDLSSLGVEVPLIDNSGTPVVATGTSFASPTVARRLARAMTKPDILAAKTAISSIERSARDLGKPGRDEIYGHGFVDD